MTSIKIEIEILPATDEPGSQRNVSFHSLRRHSALQDTAACDGPPNSTGGTLRVKPSRKRPDPSSEWKCSVCNKNFSGKFSLGRHTTKCIKNVENPPGSVNTSKEVNANVPNSVTGVTKKKKRRRHFCAICPKSFCDKKDLVYHLKSYHPSDEADTIAALPTIRKLSQCPGISWMTCVAMVQLKSPQLSYRTYLPDLIELEASVI